MKLKELLSEVPWSDVKESLLQLYKVSEKELLSYNSIYRRLQIMESVESAMRIFVEFIEPTADGFVEEGYWNVFGKDGSLVKDCDDFKHFADRVTEEEANKEQTFAIEFTPWQEWLGMTVSDETLNNNELTRADIVAHSFFEMSFISYDEKEIGDKLDDLKDRVEKVKGMSEEELKKHSINMDELHKRIEKWKDKLNNDDGEISTENGER